MTRRSGFTLIELMVAIVLTSVVALLVYATARAGLDTSERLERYRTTTGAQIVVRAMLVDALRHLPEGGGSAMGDVLFSIDDATTGAGLPADAVHFLSRGIEPPRGATPLWSVTIGPAGDEVRLTAVPLDDSGAEPIDAVLRGVRGLSARVLARTEDPAWSESWDAPGRVPAAVSLEFLTDDGAPAAPPVVVHTALEPVP